LLFERNSLNWLVFLLELVEEFRSKGILSSCKRQ
jgi:hypothetical protein